MPKRNFTLLIIILTIIIASVFLFLYFNQNANNPGGENNGTNFISQFNPFGNSRPTSPAVIPPVETPEEIPPIITTTTKEKLTKISSMPVAGFAVFSKERLKEVPITVPAQTGDTTASTTSVKTKKTTPPPTEFMPALRYVAKADGNIYQTFVDKIEERKFSTTTVPKVYEAYFGNHGGSVIMRYLKNDERTIETFVGNLPKELLGGDTTENNEIKGAFLPDNVKDISLSPDTSKVFYLWNSGNNMIGTILNLSTNKKVQVFDSPFTEWLSFWPTSNIITLSTKPSANILGYMYSIDGAGKNLTKILGGVNGLTTLGSPSGKLILYSGNNLSLNIYHTDTRNSDGLGIKTMPEKCVWGKTSENIYCAVPKAITQNEYPDTWYQGEVSFNDQLWKIDVKTGNGTMLLDPTTIEGGEEIDGIKLSLDENENYLFFVNKKDSFLWKFDLK